MPSLNHVHIYIRVKSTKGRKGQRFMCADPHCTHKELREYLIGKASRCSNCKNEFVLTHEDLKRARPLCINCSNTKEAIAFREQKEKIASILSPFLPIESEEETKAS